MLRSLVLLTLSCWIIASCRQREKAAEIMDEAIDVYLFSELHDSAKIEKSLALTNKALALDDRSIAALTHKRTLLFRKKRH